MRSIRLVIQNLLSVTTVFTMVSSVLPSLAATAQTQDIGTIVILTTDPAGAPLRGVTVTLAGPQGSYLAYTVSDGSARFQGLIPALYTATLDLDGFATLVREELRTSAGQTLTVRARLGLSTVMETVTVVGESPLIDVTTTNVGATVSEQLLNLTPTASGLWSGVLDRIPGLVNPRIDVGGGNSGQQSAITSHGSAEGQGQYTVNGALTTSLAGILTGASSMYYSIGAFEEVAVSTGAHDISAQTPGILINMVSKSGTNHLHGAARFAFLNDSFVGDNLTPELEQAGVTNGTPNTLLRDVNLQVGGPLLRDKVFAFVDFWNFRSEKLIEGAPESERDDTGLRSWTANTAWQISADHRLSLRYFRSDKYRGNRGAGARRSVESAIVQNPSYSNVVQANWQAVLSPITYADVRAGYNWGAFALVGRRPGSANPHPGYPAGVPATFDLALGTISGMPDERRAEERLAQFAGNISHYIPGERVAHSLKLGGSYWQERDWLAYVSQASTWLYRINGAPAFVELYTSPDIDVLDGIDRSTSTSQANTAFSFYLSDSISYRNRLRVNVGLRYDRSSASLPEQSRVDSRWAGLIPDEQFGSRFRAQTFPEQTSLNVFSDLVPRLSVNYDLSDSGRTLLQASYGRYSLQQGSSVATPANKNLIGWNGYFWNDLNGDDAFQIGEQGQLLYSFFTGDTSGIDPDLRSPLQEEITAGIEHQVGRDLAIRGTLIYNSTKHQTEDINIGVPYGSVAAQLGVPDSFTPIQWNDPGPDGIPGTPDDGGPVTVYSQDPSTFGDDFFLTTNLDKWGLDAPMRYRGLEMTVRKRYSNGWQAFASWTIGKATSGLGSSNNLGGLRVKGVFDNPNTDINRQGLRIDDRRHIVKVSGNYMFQGIGLNVGTNFRYESGVPVLRTIRTPRGLLHQGQISVAAAGRGGDTNPAAIGGRLDSVAILDLRLEKQFQMPGRWGRLSLYFDAFNVLNENAVRSTVNTSGPAYGQVNTIVSPRLLRLGLGWFF